MNLEIREMARQARAASRKLAAASFEKRNEVLLAIAQKLEQYQEKILAANVIDVENAAAEGLSKPLLARLKLSDAKCAGMIEGLRSLALLSDPLGHVQYAKELCPGQKLYRVACPIGVIGVIFESRPDALVQISSLCLKSGNAVLLKGGREAAHTNEVLTEIIVEATVECGLPAAWCGLLHSREDVQEMLKQHDLIDLIIPRGSNAFVRYIMQNSEIPVLGHADGLCHVYVDEKCDLELAVKVTDDSKTQNLSVCNAAETILVHEKIAHDFLPKISKIFFDKGIEIRGDTKVCQIIECAKATDDDWSTEYLDAIVSVKIVSSLEEAIEHINQYGSHHTDAIISTNAQNIETFMMLVDSADVFSNCSTRFADGFRFGFGAEVGIATGKIHARGPMGMEGLCTYKYRLYGNGETVAELNTGKLSLMHANIDHKLPC